MFETVFFFCLGLLVLTIGAEFLVRGATLLSSALGIPTLVVGLTVVAFGTGAPEFVVSLVAGAAGKGDIALGNIVGSNIMNILLILGGCALFAPIVVHKKVIYRDVPVMVAVSLIAWWIVADGEVSALEGVFLIICLLIYTIAIAHEALKEVEEEERPEDEELQPPRTLVSEMVLILGGVGLLILGSQWTVTHAQTIARALGISELIIGLTLVSIGTSLPEVATSFMAAYKGEKDLAVGNVVGSCIFNILGVMGIASLVAPHGLVVSQALIHFSFPVMIAAGIACLPIFFTGHKIARWEGALFLGYYALYIIYLFLRADQHEGITTFTSFVFCFVIPLTGIGIAISLFRCYRQRYSPSVE